MRRILTLGCILLGINTLYGQQDPQFSHNQFNHTFVNPATVGLKENMLCGNLIYRNQWTGFQGAPKTAVLNLHGNIPELAGGWGVSFLSDNLGQEKNFSLKAKYSYQTVLMGGNFSAGIAAGMLQKTLGNKWVTTDTPAANDPSINTTVLSDVKMDVDLGVFYQKNEMYVGLSATNLIQQEVVPNFKNKRHYYVTGGYNFKTLSTAFEFKPSVFIKSDLVVTQVDINAMFEFRSALYAGITYRVEDAIVPIVGIQKKIPAGHFRCGVAYDITTSALSGHQWGTPEVFASLCVPLVKKSVEYMHTRSLGKQSQWHGITEPIAPNPVIEEDSKKEAGFRRGE